MGQGLVIAASRSHSDTPHAVAVLLTRDRADAETSTRQYTTLAKDQHPCHRRCDSNTQSQKASGPQTHALDRAVAGIGQEDRWMDTHQPEASIVPMTIAAVLLQTCALTDVSTLLKGRD